MLRTSGLALAGGAGLLAVGTTTAACTVGRSDDPAAPLRPLAVSADADAAAADRLAAAEPDRAGALHTVADERRAHAAALRTEIDRVSSTAPQTAPASTASTPPSPSEVPPSLDGLRSSLEHAQRAAADVACRQSGYRAGLTGSISAACAAERKVLLA